MDNNRLPKHALNYKHRGRRDHGRPRKRWQRVDGGTGQTTYSMKEDDDDDDKYLKFSLDSPWYKQNGKTEVHDYDINIFITKT